MTFMIMTNLYNFGYYTIYTTLVTILFKLVIYDCDKFTQLLLNYKLVIYEWGQIYTTFVI